MEWKSPPPNRDFIFPFELFNTPRNEIAPGSDVVGKYLKRLHFPDSSFHALEP